MANPLNEIEEKWQERWYSEGIHESEVESKPKYMIIFAYPGVTGYLHVGHMRGYTYVDAISRYKRMRGYNVLFPVGTHATGNGAISLAKRVEEGDENTIRYLLSNGCPEGKLDDLEDPYKVVEFFNDVYVNQYWKRFGFLADWRRFTCTTNPDYKKFIQWQFMKLKEKDLLIQKPYYAPACMGCGPVAVDPSETDLQKGGKAEINEYTILKFNCGDLFLVAATLRPETVYGQTNFWANPDVEYLKASRGDETWVMSKPAYEKMKYQMDDLQKEGTISGEELIGRKCDAPVIHREVPVLPARFCDPNVGTGLVTSVPSDAPDDWMALEELKRDKETLEEFGLEVEEVRAIEAIPIIDSEGYGPLPAKEIIEEMGIEESGDPRLEEAKKVVYKAGFHTGTMNENCQEFSGMRVERAKEEIQQMMVDNGEAVLFYDLSEEVICRCGGPVVIKKVPDQWFIDYASPWLTADSKEHSQDMHILPEDYSHNIQGVLDWFRERACVRQGDWLGTTFPFDDKWIIEAISDSTLYPIYYLISRYANSGVVEVEQMDEQFFDYVILGRGDIGDVSSETGVPIDDLHNMSEEIEYWYPLDINLGGKEHMTVHFPAFLMNHVAVLPEDKWPSGIFVHWYITGEVGKISKSKGGAEPIPDAAERFGVDPLRLFYAHIASPFQDVAWDEEAVKNYGTRVDKIFRLVNKLIELPESDEMSNIDRWLLSRMNSRVGAIIDGMRSYDIRGMANEVYFEMFNDIKWYLRRGGDNGTVIDRLLRVWIKLMTPITPHIAEELWESIGGKGLVSQADFPEYEEQVSLEVESSEQYLKDVLSDIKEILKVTGISPGDIHLYVSPQWKESVFRMGVDMAQEGEISIPSLTKEVMSLQEMRERGKEAANFARTVAEDLTNRSQEEIERLSIDIDEFDYLENALDFLENEFGCQAHVYDPEADGLYDPEGKSSSAQPRRPAIYIEESG